jgi:hypothetical protein
LSSTGPEKLFVPISLGNHFYSSKVLKFISTRFLEGAAAAVILLCDRLRYISYQIRGETNNTEIESRIAKQAAELRREISNVGLNRHPNTRVENWSILCTDPRYGAVLEALERLVEENHVIQKTLVDLAYQRIYRFRDPYKPIVDYLPLQRRYLIEESAMSMFVTEIMGYPVEIYRDGGGFVDFLYANYEQQLKAISGKDSLERRFVPLEEKIKEKPLLRL